MTIAPTLNNRLCLTVDEVAAVLGCSRRQVYRLLESDESFPWITYGKRRWVPVAGLREWVAGASCLGARR